MGDMKLIMETWRRFRISEADAPRFKEEPQDTMALLKALSTETDQQKVQKVLLQLLADKDVAQVLGALEEMFQELTADEDVEVDIEEGLDDLSRAVAGAGLDIAAKTEEFLTSTPTGRFVKKVSGPLLGLALGAALLQGGGEITPGSLRTISKLVSGAHSAESLGNAVIEIGAEAGALQERKKI